MMNYLKMSKEEGETLQVWTESPCLHKRISKPTKEPKPYKIEPILTDEEFLKFGVNDQDKAEFYKKYGKEINRKDLIIPLERRKMIALKLLKNWVENELH